MIVAGLLLFIPISLALAATRSSDSVDAAPLPLNSLWIAHRTRALGPSKPSCRTTS